MRRFDEQFADKVREVFDLYTEPVDPQAWESLKGRLGQTRRARVVALLPLLSRAAAVLLFVSLSALIYMNVLLPGEEGRLAEAFPAGESEQPADGGSALSVPVGMGADAPVLPERMSASQGYIPEDATSFWDENPPVEAARIRTGGTVPVILASADPPRALPSGTSPDQVFDTWRASSRTAPAGLLAAGLWEEDSSYPGGTGLAVLDVPGGGPDYGFNLSVTAGSMMTFAERQLASGMGFSGGVLTEWQAFPRMKLASGMLLAYQQFEVEGMPLRMVSAQEINSGLAYNPSAEAFGDHAYEFLAIDIPLNVQLSLNESRNSQLYVSAGVSSLLYLQQRVSGYSSSIITGQTYNPVTDHYQTFSHFSEVYLDDSYDILSRFDLARLLNFSVGYVIKGQNHSTIIEPFIKYPLGTISTRELRMGMGGVTLRYRFGSD